MSILCGQGLRVHASVPVISRVALRRHALRHTGEAFCCCRKEIAFSSQNGILSFYFSLPKILTSLIIIYVLDIRTP
jgi:hypothetical protein